MSTAATLLNLLCLGMAPCSGGPFLVSETGNKAVDLLIADIAERRRDAAVARISRVGSVTGRPQIVRAPAQFVDRLLGCSPIPGSAKTLGKYSYRVEWSCSGKKLFADFDVFKVNSYIEVLLEDEVTHRIPAVAPAPPLRGPDRHVPPSEEFIGAVARSIVFEENITARTLMRGETIVSLARRDAHKGVDVYERDELGPDAVLPIVSAAIKRVGKPISFKCSQERYGGTCNFTFDRPGVALTCWIGAYNGRINAIRFIWQTHEQDILDSARRWEVG